MGFHRIVILRRRHIVGLSYVSGGSHARRNVAMGRARRRADAHGSDIETLAIGQVRAGLGRFVSRIEQGSPFRCRLQRFGNHQCDRLADIAHLVVLQHLDAEAEGRHLLVRVMRQRRSIGWGQDFDDAGMRLGRSDVERRDTPACDATDGDDSVEHALWVVVGSVGCATGDLEHAITARQWLAGIRPVAAGLCGNVLKRHG